MILQEEGWDLNYLEPKIVLGCCESSRMCEKNTAKEIYDKNKSVFNKSFMFWSYIGIFTVQNIDYHRLLCFFLHWCKSWGSYQQTHLKCIAQGTRCYFLGSKSKSTGCLTVQAESVMNAGDAQNTNTSGMPPAERGLWGWICVYRSVLAGRGRNLVQNNGTTVECRAAGNILSQSQDSPRV